MKPEGRPRGGPTAQGRVPPSGDRGTAAEAGCAPRRPPRDALWPINHPRRKTLTPEGFSQIRYRAPPPSPTSFEGQIVLVVISNFALHA